MMNSQTESASICSAVISTDPSFRKAVGVAARLPASGISLECEIDVPFSEISAGILGRLRQSDPELIFLDLEQDPGLGIRFAQHLVESDPKCRVIASGPALSADHLLEAMRAGVAEYLPKPVDLDTLQEAVNRVARKLSPVRGGPPARQVGSVFTCYGAKGGCGTTTLAVNFAIDLQQTTRKKVLVVDLDLEFGAVAAYLGLEPRFSVLDLVKNLHRVDANLLPSYVERHSSGVSVLAAPVQIDGVGAVTGDHVRKILQLVRQNYDYVIVDTAKSFTPATLAGLEQATEVLLLTTTDLPSLRNLKRSIGLLARITKGGKDRFRLVINRYHAKDVVTPQDVERTLGMPVSWTLSNDYASVIRSINEGKPLALDGKSTYVRDLRALARELAGSEAADESRGSLFGPLRQALGRFAGSKPEFRKSPEILADYA